MTKINVVIVGYGGMGSYHGNTIIPAQNDKLTVTGAYDVLPERIEAAKEAGLETYESFEAVLADEKVEVVLIATPNDSHKVLAIAALRKTSHDERPRIRRNPRSCKRDRKDLHGAPKPSLGS